MTAITAQIHLLPFHAHQGDTRLGAATAIARIASVARGMNDQLLRGDKLSLPALTVADPNVAAASGLSAYPGLCYETFVRKEMLKKVAIVTDITSAGFWFPVWYKYYSGLFGPESLFVVSYSGASEYLEGFKLGASIRITQPYSDKFRAYFISNLVKDLLLQYDVVLRVDVDEFLLADPRSYKNLAAYIDEFRGEYVTALGFDVLQEPSDAELREDQPILVNQRKLAILNSALNKTAVTICNLRWGPGFHGCDRKPVFDALYLAHMKFANVAGRGKWNSLMVGMVAKGSSESEYFFNSGRDLKPQSTSFLERPRKKSWDALDLDLYSREFLATVYEQVLVDGQPLFQGRFAYAENTFIIPDECKNIL